MRPKDASGYGAEEPVDLARTSASLPIAPRPDSGRQHPPEPTLLEGGLLARPPSVTTDPARWGWRGRVRALTGGLIKPKPGTAEARYRLAEVAARQYLGGARLVMVANPKGGSGVTTTALLLAHTFAALRGGSVVAWDNAEPGGNLGDRAEVTTPDTSVWHLLAASDRLVTGASAAGDMSYYLRSQPSGAEVLAADSDTARREQLGAGECGRIAVLLARYFRLTVMNTGHDIRASGWQWSSAAADCLVVPITLDHDVAQTASWMLDALEAWGRGSLVAGAVVVVRPGATAPTEQARFRILEHFHARCAVVVEVPHDTQLAGGAPLVFGRIGLPARRAWVAVAAAVADQLAAVHRSRPDQAPGPALAPPPARGAPAPRPVTTQGDGASITALPIRRAQA